MPACSAICASSGEYTPPVKRYSSSVSSWRNFRPMVSTRWLLARRGARQRGGAPLAIGGRGQLDRAAPAARGAAVVATIVPCGLERHVARARTVHGSSPWLLKLERTGGLDHACAEQGSGAAPAIRDGFEGHGAGWAAGGSAVDTSKVVPRV